MGEILARLRGLAQNRLALAGAAGAAGLGAVTLIRKRKAGTSSGTSSGQGGDDTAGLATGGETYTGAGSFPSSYQTDLATALGDLDSRYAASVAEYSSQLGSTDDALKAINDQQSSSISALGAQLAALRKAAAAKKPAKARKPVKPPTPAAGAKAWGKTYKIKKGDTLGTVAKKFGVSVGAIAKHNNIANPNVIAAGRTIKVPG